MEILESRIKQINQELIELTKLKENLEHQLNAISLQIAQKIGAINELKNISDTLATS